MNAEEIVMLEEMLLMEEMYYQMEKERCEREQEEMSRRQYSVCEMEQLHENGYYGYSGYYGME
mgnify:CR=1 FL=1